MDKGSEDTSKVSYPKWYTNLMKDVAGTLGDYAGDPKVTVAGRTADQTAAGDGYRNLMSYLQGTGGMEQGALSTLGRSGRAVDQAISAGNLAASAAGNVDKISAGDISALANPYMEEQQAIGMRRLGEARDSSQANIGQRAAAAGAFGGSREALERSNLANNYMTQVNDMRAQTASDAYGVGAQLAGTNAAAQNNSNQAAANYLMQGGQNAANYMMQGVTADQNAYGLASNLANQYAGRMSAGIGGLYGYGNDMQGYNQQVADAADGYTGYQRTMPLWGGGVPTTTTQSSNNNGDWMGALTMGLSFL